MCRIIGKIIRGVGGFYYVETTGATIYECKAKGIFRKEDITPLVGDDVSMTVVDEDKCIGNIDEILPRKNALIRPAVANVDMAMVVFALKSPGLNPGLLDRFLVMMETEGIPVWLCLTKADLSSPGHTENIVGIYESCTEGVSVVNNLDGSGIKEVRAALRGRTTVLAGPSGVGKSSLVRHICPDVSPEVGSISKKTERGKHTTRHSELFRIDEGTFIFDTPGFSSLRLPEMMPEELSAYIPEFDGLCGGCRFPMCTHTHEPGCSVKEQIGIGISESRYESYRQMFDELNALAVKAGRSKR